MNALEPSIVLLVAAGSDQELNILGSLPSWKWLFPIEYKSEVHLDQQFPLKYQFMWGGEVQSAFHTLMHEILH